MATTDKGRTFAALACHLLQSGVAASPEQAAVMACDLVPISRKLHKLAERQCNEPEPRENYFADARSVLDLRAVRTLDRGEPGTCALTVEHKTDPRAGFGLLLKFPDGRTNDWGQEGIIVPCRVED